MSIHGSPGLLTHHEYVTVTKNMRADVVTDGSKKPGRKPLYKTAMDGKTRAAKRREVLHLKITAGNPDKWDHQVCIAALSNTKYAHFQEAAWRRLGVIMGFTDQPDPEE